MTKLMTTNSCVCGHVATDHPTWDDGCCVACDCSVYHDVTIPEPTYTLVREISHDSDFFADRLCSAQCPRCAVDKGARS